MINTRCSIHVGHIKYKKYLSDIFNPFNKEKNSELNGKLFKRFEKLPTHSLL